MAQIYADLIDMNEADQIITQIARAQKTKIKKRRRSNFEKLNS